MEIDRKITKAFFADNGDDPREEALIGRHNMVSIGLDRKSVRKLAKGHKGQFDAQSSDTVQSLVVRQ